MVWSLVKALPLIAYSVSATCLQVRALFAHTIGTQIDITSYNGIKTRMALSCNVQHIYTYVHTLQQTNVLRLFSTSGSDAVYSSKISRAIHHKKYHSFAQREENQGIVQSPTVRLSSMQQTPSGNNPQRWRTVAIMLRAFCRPGAHRAKERNVYTSGGLCSAPRPHASRPRTLRQNFLIGKSFSIAFAKKAVAERCCCDAVHRTHRIRLVGIAITPYPGARQNPVLSCKRVPLRRVGTMVATSVSGRASM